MKDRPALEMELLLEGVADREGAAAELRELMLGVGADRVEPVRVPPPPSDRRPADVVAVAALAVSFVGTAFQVVDVVRSWLARQRSDDDVGVIQIVINGEAVQIVEPPTEDERARIDEFIRRHDGDDDR
jgi:hypothetical protein